MLSQLQPHHQFADLRAGQGQLAFLGITPRLQSPRPLLEEDALPALELMGRHLALARDRVERPAPQEPQDQLRLPLFFEKMTARLPEGLRATLGFGLEQGLVIPQAPASFLRAWGRAKGRIVGLAGLSLRSGPTRTGSTFHRFLDPEEVGPRLLKRR